MKDKFEALLLNNKTRAIFTVAAVLVIVAACIGIGASIASSKAADADMSDKNNNKAHKAVTSQPTKHNAAVTSDSTAQNTDSTAVDTKGNNSSQNTSSFIGKSKAKSIAKNKVGGGKVSYCVLDYDDGVAEYEVKIIKGNYEYEMEIDALTGDIRDYDKDYLEKYDDDDYDDDYNGHHDDYDDHNSHHGYDD